MIKKLPNSHYFFIPNTAIASSALTFERLSTQQKHCAQHTSRQQPITSASTSTTMTSNNASNDIISLTSRCPPLVQESFANDSLPEAITSSSDCSSVLMHLLHDQTSAAATDDEESFTIKRKLLRRRHVRKEQVQKRREKQVVKSTRNSSSTRSVEKKEANRRKRTAEQRKRLQANSNSHTTTTIPQSPKMFTPKRCLMKQFDESADCSSTIVGSITFVYPAPQSNKTKNTRSFHHRIPRFSPVRPSRSLRQRRFL